MKKVTARITMSVLVTDEEYEEIVEMSKTPSMYPWDVYVDVEVENDLLDKFKEKGFIDVDYGDSYIPGAWIECLEED